MCLARSQNPKRVSAEWLEKFNKSQADKLDLFKVFLEHEMSVEDTELTLKRSRRKRCSDTQDMGWLDRDGLMDLHKNKEDVVDAIIKAKTKQGLCKPHPDCPHVKSKMLYHVTVALPGP
jgi:hypothetical protein